MLISLHYLSAFVWNMVDSLFTFFFLLLETKSFTNRHSFARDESRKAIFSVSRFIFIFCATLNSRSRFCSWSLAAILHPKMHAKLLYRPFSNLVKKKNSFCWAFEAKVHTGGKRESLLVLQALMYLVTIFSRYVWTIEFTVSSTRKTETDKLTRYTGTDTSW